MKNGLNPNHALMSALLIVSAIVLGAISLNYSGHIQVKLGVDGIQLQIDGQCDRVQGDRA